MFGEMYFSQDRRDGRVAFGNAFVNCTLNCTSKNIYLLLSAEKPDARTARMLSRVYARQNSARKSQLLTQANLSSDLGRQLVLSADAYVVRRDSGRRWQKHYRGLSVFEDWGRDTMISLAGATLVTGRFEESARAFFGRLPNM